MLLTALAHGGVTASPRPANAARMGHLFISYSNQDGAEEANALARALEAGGHRCWIAPRDVKPAIPYPGQIVAAIETCAGLVLMMSAAANQSPDVLQEVQLASTARKLIAPVIIAGTAPAPNLRYYIGVRHQIAWTDAGATAAALGAAFDTTSANSAILGASSPGVDATHRPPQGSVSAAWAKIEASLDPNDYADFAEVFRNTQEGIDALRRKRQLETWTRVARDDVAALTAFVQTASFPALDAAARDSLRIAEAAQARRETEAIEARRKAEEAARARETADALARRKAAAEARGHAEEVWSKFLDDGGLPDMVTIPRGRFLMGSPANEEGRSDREGPQREVRIEYVFALGKHAVTFAQWDAALAAGAKLSNPNDKGWGRDDRPVINVSWEDARAYVAWLNEGTGGFKPAENNNKSRQDAGGPYRLPSEAEWEYACRAGTTTPFSFGATISAAQASYDGNYTYGAGKKGEYRQKTSPVGSFPANAFGLHDMHGNVCEWCEDCWNANYNGGPTNGSAWTIGDCSLRVLRGGSWNGLPEYRRSASRRRYFPSERYDYVGFRVARSASGG